MPRGMRIYVAFSGCSVVLFALMAWAYREFRTVARHKDGEARSIDLLDGESSNPQGSAVASRRPTVVFEYSRQGSAGISHYRSEIVAISNGAHEELPSD